MSGTPRARLRPQTTPSRLEVVRARVIRNTQMIEAANHAVFFWNGKSKGTADAIEKAEGKGIPVEVVRFPIGDSA